MARLATVEFDSWEQLQGILTTTNDGDEKLISSSYRTGAQMRALEAFNAKDVEIRLEWEAFNHGYCTHSFRLVDEEGVSYKLNPTAYTTNNSYGGSIYLPYAKYYTRIDVKDGVATMVTATGDYDDKGGTVYRTESARSVPQGNVYFDLALGDNYGSTTGGVYVYGLYVLGDFFDGDFIPLEIDDPLIENIAIPSNVGLTTSVGTGLLNNQGNTVYLKVSEVFNQGDVRYIVTDDGVLLVTVTYGVGGSVTLYDHTTLVTTTGVGDGLLFVTNINGMIVVLDGSGNVIVHGYEFHSVELSPTFRLLDGETVDTIPTGYVSYEEPQYVFVGYFASPKPTWGNRETYEQANPQSVDITTEVLTGAPSKTLIAKTGNYLNIIDSEGVFRLMGYYESVTTLANNPIGNRRVFCLTNMGQLVDETVSDINGNYRFDYLLMSEKYMFIAQYNKDTREKPDYLAAASDWQTPTPY